ncbi:MAG: cation:proton antiporter [Candidatus Marinimicrobia bacterium]|nr:cation:proton antiporter [Candidatus Neomarinimicrobiota bacterium]
MVQAIFNGGFQLAAVGHGFDWTDPAVIFALALVTVLVSPMLFERARLPGLVGLIVAGILLGPHALGKLPTDSLVSDLGAVGLLYLMFLAGLEVDMLHFRKERHNSLCFGLITFLIPQVLGTLGAVYGLGFGWAKAILLASMFASHTLVPYPIIQRLGLVKERVVTTTVGGTVITDTLALLVLAVIAESTRGALDAAFWIRQAVLFVLYVGIILWTLPRLGRWVMRRLADNGVALLLFVLAAALTCAALAPLAGLEPIIGAFLAGLVLNSLVPERSTLMTRLHFMGAAFFIPFFLISVGIRVDLRVFFGEPKAWIVMGYMVGMVTFSKWTAAILSGRLLRFSRTEAGVLFGLSVNQAAATLAAVMVGVQLDIFDEAVLNGTILMILTTCTLGPWVIERVARRLALQRSEAAVDSSGGAERIVLPIQRPSQIEPLIELALLLRNPDSREPLYPLAVVQDNDDAERSVAQGERLLAPAMLRAIEAEAPVQPTTRLAASLAHGVLQAARDLRASTIILDDDLQAPDGLENSVQRITEEGRHFVLRWRRPGPLNTCKRLVVFLPPWIERMPGFGAAWEALLRLREQAGLSLLVLAERRTLATLKRRDWLPPDAPEADTRELSRWVRAAAVWRTVAQADDLPVLFMARYGRLAWTSVQPRLPDLLARAVPTGRLLMVYPPEMKWEAPAPAEATANRQALTLFPEQSVNLNWPGQPLQDVLARLVARHYPKEAEARAVLGALRQVAEESPLPLDERSLLLHIHGAPPPAPMAWLVTSAEGFRLPTTDVPVHNLVVLLAGQGEPPEDHLNRLGQIAVLFRQPKWQTALTQATSYADLAAAAPAGNSHQ